MNKAQSFGDLEAILRGRKHYEIIDFPFARSDTENTLKVAVKVLSQKEIEDSYLYADIKYRNRFPDEKDFRSMPGHMRELERQILYRAIVQIPAIDEETQKITFEKFFPNPEAIGDLLSIDQTTILMSYYNETQEKFSPAAAIKSEEDFLEVIEHCKKKSIRGLSLSMLELEMLVDFLVKNPSILLKDSGTSSSPSKNSEENGNSKPSTTPKEETEKNLNEEENNKSPRVEFKT